MIGGFGNNDVNDGDIPKYLNFDLNDYDDEDIDAYLRIKNKNIIYPLECFTDYELKTHLRKSKLNKLSKKSWKFW